MKIERDDSGFATDECLDEMFNMLPVVVRCKDGSLYLIYDIEANYYRGEIERDTYYTHWQPITIPEFTD